MERRATDQSAQIVVVAPRTRAQDLVDQLSRVAIKACSFEPENAEAKLGRHFRAEILVFDRLPQHFAWELAKLARALDAVDWLIITGASEEAERIVGLELGADDVLPDIGDLELVAKIRALIRRRHNTGKHRTVQFDQFVCDVDSRRIHDANDGNLHLTGREQQLLFALIQQPHRVLTRSQLLDQIGDQGRVFERAIDTCIARLRRKLIQSGASKDIIKTIRGLGYQFSPNTIEHFRRCGSRQTKVQMRTVRSGLA